MREQRRIERHQLPFYLRVFNAITDKPIGSIGNVSADGLLLVSELPMLVGSLSHARDKVVTAPTSPASDAVAWSSCRRRLVR